MDLTLIVLVLAVMVALGASIAPPPQPPPIVVVQQAQPSVGEGMGCLPVVLLGLLVLTLFATDVVQIM